MCIWAGTIEYNKLQATPDVTDMGLTAICLVGKSNSVLSSRLRTRKPIFLFSNFTIAIMAPPRDATNVGTTLDYQTIVASWSPEERAAREKTLKRKIDLRLLPILVSTHLYLSDIMQMLLTYY